MRLLLSNDDGINAQGLKVLAEGLAAVAKVITVVAPDRDRSGASNSLTLDQPLRVRQTEDSNYVVQGTPTDCVHLALTGLMDTEPDMVVSGINHGANLGDDVIYSGTVAAAMEGRFLGLPAVAVSLCMRGDEPNFASAAKAAAMIVERLVTEPLPADTILNVNVPDLPWNDIAGFEVTRLGHRHRAEEAIADLDPRGRRIYWIGPAGAEQDAGPGTDFHAINSGHISITPIHVDLTRYQALDTVSSWVGELGENLGKSWADAGSGNEPA